MLARWSFLATFFSTAIAATPYIQQSFFFDWNPEGAPVPIPVTAQCSTIHIKWSRAAAKGPNPSPPYFLQIYTSTSLEPFIVNAGNDLSYDFTVPFPVDTQYQICMFDQNGYTGGCQGIYTVTNPLANATRCDPIDSLGTLAVEGTVANGPISRYGWIDTCTDISVLPRNGTPPFTYTIAPSLHPPYNITSSYATPMNWTVILSWASPFFISVADSAGNAWSQGPLHAGGDGKTFCLDTDEQTTPVNSTNSPSTQTVIAAGVGGGLGGLALGLIAGIIGAVCCYKRRRAPSQEVRPHLDQYPSFPKQPLSSPSIYPSTERPISTIAPLPSPSVYQTTPDATSTQFHNQGYPQAMQVAPSRGGNWEPYAAVGRESYVSVGRRPPSAGNHSTTGYQRSEAESIAGGPSGSSRGERPASDRVYIVHNDSGQAPVRVYTGGADVVELPPQYADNGSTPLGAGSVDKQRMALQEHVKHADPYSAPPPPHNSSSSRTSLRPSVPLPTPPSQHGETFSTQQRRPSTPSKSSPYTS